MSPRVCAALTVLLPAAALANGGSSDWVERTTSGALAPADGGALGTTELRQEDDVECASEDLAITFRPKDVAVRVAYVFLNHGPTKTIAYAFPFAIGEQDLLVRGKLKDTKRFGEPSEYTLAVDDKPVDAVVRKGTVVPGEIPVPSIADNEGVDEEHADRFKTEARYRWSYRVSRIVFPKGRQVRITVTYAVPHLVYASRNYGITSPGAFSYLLSTGGGWRGNTIGKLHVLVTGDGVSTGQLQVEGLPVERRREGWVYEERSFKPEVKTNLVVSRREFETLELSTGEEALRHVLDRPMAEGVAWSSPPVTGKAPAELRLEVSGQRCYRQGVHVTRYRMGLAFDPAGAMLARARVKLAWDGQNADPVIFNAAFKPTSEDDIKANGGYRYIWFDAEAPPRSVTLTLLDAAPGPGGERRVRLTGVVMQCDVSNYEAEVPHER